MTNTRTLPQIAKAIKVLEKKSIQNVVEIGELLHEASELCEHGEYMNWIKREFSFSHDTSLNYRSAYELSQNPNCSDYANWDMSLKTFYLVARFLKGDEIEVGAAKAIIRAARKRRVSSTDALLIVKEYEEKHPPLPPEPDPVAVEIDRLFQLAEAGGSEMEKTCTNLIKNRQLFEGACGLPWLQYFEYRDAHPDECPPLTPDDLAYVGQWTSAGAQPDVAGAEQLLNAFSGLTFYAFRPQHPAWPKVIEAIGGSVKLLETIEHLKSVYEKHCGQGDPIKTAADRAEVKAKSKKEPT
jgi:hypothetical protein